MKDQQQYNPNKDLLKALRYLECIVEMKIVKHQKNLNGLIKNIRSVFAQTLLDCLDTSEGGLTAQEMSFARENQHIPALKLIRERTGMGIMEAKKCVEKWQRENGVDPYGGQH